MYKKELTSIAESIIASKNTVEHLVNAKRLSEFYNKVKSFNYSENNETTLKGGVALSSSGAADCVDDYLRTVFFIKGVYKAMLKLCADFPEKPINILYAGCGPYATLLLPLLSLFEKEKINAILLDINAVSIKSVLHLLADIGFDNYSIQLFQADAITYVKPENFSIDLAISETMDYALTNEPQVAITKNIVPQLDPHSIFIPQEIRLDLVYSFFNQEPFFKNDLNAVKGRTKMQPYPDSVFVNRLFTINKEQFSSRSNNSTFESNFYDLPTNYSNHPDVCIFTEIQIYQDIELRTAESYITNPFCAASMYNLNNYSKIQMVYDFSETPKWFYNLKE